MDKNNYDLKTLLNELENQRMIQQNLFLAKEKVDNKINDLEKTIYSICNHNWVIDRAQYSEHTEYICSCCNLEKY
jgi:hypothetical protein